MTDGNLLQAAVCGDEAAFRLLYERHREVVFRFAYRLLQSIELAEEMTHDCFLSLIKKPTRFDDALTWIFACLVPPTFNATMS